MYNKYSFRHSQSLLYKPMWTPYDDSEGIFDKTKQSNMYKIKYNII